MKAEVVRLEDRSPRDNARSVVTNLRHSPGNVYLLYRDGGDSESGSRSSRTTSRSNRTSCMRFWANQLRVLLTAAAFVLFQQMRLRLSRCTNEERPTAGTMRLRLLKIAVRVQRSARRVVLHFSASHVWAAEWTRLARSCGAVPL